MENWISIAFFPLAVFKDSLFWLICCSCIYFRCPIFLLAFLFDLCQSLTLHFVFCVTVFHCSCTKPAANTPTKSNFMKFSTFINYWNCFRGESVDFRVEFESYVYFFTSTSTSTSALADQMKSCWLSLPKNKHFTKHLDLTSDALKAADRGWKLQQVMWIGYYMTSPGSPVWSLLKSVSCGVSKSWI